MLNWDLIKWIVICFYSGNPSLAFFFMNKWLENFAYKIDPKLVDFCFGWTNCLLLAAITISVQSWKASSRNPVEALRYE